MEDGRGNEGVTIISDSSDKGEEKFKGLSRDWMNRICPGVLSVILSHSTGFIETALGVFIFWRNFLALISRNDISRSIY